MRSYEFPYPEAEQQTVVSRFGGIDCRTHPTKVSLSRSPDMQNMICDQNDFLVKRTGWRTQAQFNAPIYGLFAMPDGVGCAVHAGAKLYFGAGRHADRAVQRHERGVFPVVYDEGCTLPDGRRKPIVRCAKAAKIRPGKPFPYPAPPMCRPRPSLRRRPAAAPATRPVNLLDTQAHQHLYRGRHGDPVQGGRDRPRRNSCHG